LFIVFRGVAQMFFSKVGDKNSKNRIQSLLQSHSFQIALIGTITVLIVFILIMTGAAPKKYKLNLGDESPYDITAPRDIEDKLKTEENKKAAYAAEPQVTKEIITAPIEVLNQVEDFFTSIDAVRKEIEKKLQEQEITPKSKNYAKQLEVLQETAVVNLEQEVKTLKVLLSREQVRYLAAKASDDELSLFKRIARELVSNAMKEDITEEALINQIDKVQNQFQQTSLPQDFVIIGSILVKTTLKPNRAIDDEQTTAKRKAAAERENTVIIPKGTRIISKGGYVSTNVVQILTELNLLETSSRFDILFAVGILVIILLLGVVLVVFIRFFCNWILKDRSDTILLCVIIVITLLISRAVNGYFSPLAIPIFMATMLVSILLNLGLASVVNCLLVIAISFLVKGDLRFIYMGLISGIFSAFLVNKANQRSKLSMAGIIVGMANVLIIVCLGIINKGDVKTIVADSMIVFLNGIVSIVLTIGLLPFFEATFNIITPLKLLELANPNQPLIKRLLMEAPGTYHHSLMVGNLAEVATEAIGGNSLLARVGAYFHDIGKLKRPNFFKENQMTDNPHDRMTANLSTLVITSHTHDGVELAEKYKIPLAIREIIRQHHGTTLVAYFYHKAKKGEKGDTVKQENFRYEGPKPSTKEAAVVMLADSVEAAVRSMMDKTEGKIEGLVRKLIKDKLDDGQLDLCSLTLKDMDHIAKAFMRVLSGYFHEREEYPEVKIKGKTIDMEPMEVVETTGSLEDADDEGSIRIDSFD
jgi:cyclic-di-AMP phosphodiesterase PgpH